MFYSPWKLYATPLSWSFLLLGVLGGQTENLHTLGNTLSLSHSPVFHDFTKAVVFLVLFLLLCVAESISLWLGTCRIGHSGFQLIVILLPASREQISDLSHLASLG